MSKRKLSIVGRDPESVMPTAEPVKFALQIIIQPNVDGAPLQPLVVNGEIGVPEEQQTAVVKIDIDGRAFVRGIGEQIAAHDRRNQRGALALPSKVSPADLALPAHVKRGTND